MKRVFCSLFAALALAAPAAAQQTGLLGLGIMAGSPTGGTGKYWLSDRQAVDAAIGFSGNLQIHGDYLWHAWDVFPPTDQGRLAGYLGVGVRMRNRESDSVELGVRTPAGVAYWVKRYPIELFVEIVPVFDFNADHALDLDGVMGLRVYFPGAAKKKAD